MDRWYRSQGIKAFHRDFVHQFLSVFSRDNILVIMANFVVVKFDEISTYGTNPFKCVPAWWLCDSVGTKVQVPYPSKYQIFDGFRNIIEREPPIDEWKKYTGTVVYRTGTYRVLIG